ncbi:hypothetical protein F5Y17DRAFT_400038 [Xylariaceae sp. FL0594]|nr:hypothetical protein F5Y17DRAFT_400038 [Xylariaceae sp. FL0594]
MPTFEIKVLNRSGRPQEYTLSNERPIIATPDEPEPWNLSVFKMSCPPDASAVFTVTVDEYFAYSTVSRGKPGNGVRVEVRSSKPVELGQANADGSFVPGSTVNLTVNGGSPGFRQAESPGGKIGAFEIQTGMDFTAHDAADGNLMIGVGNKEVPFSLFRPSPGLSYQITPRNVFYLTCGDVARGSIVDVARLGQTVEIDFTQMASTHVTVVQTPDGSSVLGRD